MFSIEPRSSRAKTLKSHTLDMVIEMGGVKGGRGLKDSLFNVSVSCLVDWNVML